ncbi:MAG: hypothetical protein ACREUB_07605 [Burkholderiales bacterium]
MRRALGRTWKAFLVLAFIAYQYLVHTSVSSTHTGALYPILLWLPLAALALWVLVRSSNKPAWLAALAAAGIAVYLAEHQERLGLAAVSGISHAAAYLFLLWYFGRTLMRERESLITRYARRVHGALPPDLELFTRRLTAAWCVFFAAQLIASGLLLAFAPLEAWSFFINLLNFPLVAFMFSGQFVYRMVRHPDWPRASIWQAVEAFTEDATLSGSAEVR